MKAGWGRVPQRCARLFQLLLPPPGHPRAAGDGHSAAVQKQWGRRGVGAVPRSVPMDGVRLYTRLDGMAQNKTNLYIYISIYTNI